MRGGWQEALPLLEKAAALDPKARRIADNLELARAALAENLPRRRAGESDSDWAARLNDAGVLAVAGGQRQRAIAAFSQAIEANSQWFERAANNLAIVEGRD
jgi:tetratricopeptide (TPR) repeat protein